MKLRSNYAKEAGKKRRPKHCCVWISTCSSYKLLYFLLICSCEIPQKKICGLWLDTPTIRLKAKICNSRLWQQYILSSFCRHWCLRLLTRQIGVKSQMKSHFNKYCYLNNFTTFFNHFLHTYHKFRRNLDLFSGWHICKSECRNYLNPLCTVTHNASRQKISIFEISRLWYCDSEYHSNLKRK